jgi:uridine monophosphate synthetase
MTERPAFFTQLEARARQEGTLLCVGLDPQGNTPEALRSDCLRLIEATAPYVAAYKPNSAFFEAHGPAGFTVLKDVIASIPADIPVLLDAKRGDIAHTARAYAQAAFDALGAGAVTVSPYVGGDGLAPFLARPDRAAFVLCKTSNPAADELQALQVLADGRSLTLYEAIAERASSWSAYDNVGLVVGATDPAAMARVRALAPELWFLVPGIGAQGGSLADIITAGLRADGLGLLINVSRSLASAADPAAEARRLRDEIRSCQQAAMRRGASPMAPAADGAGIAELAEALLPSGCVRFGQFRLKSGIVSPIYLDLRRLVSHPTALLVVARAYAGLLRGIRYDRLAGIPYAALPIATAIGLTLEQPLVYPRREAKDYGTRAVVEGEFEPGEVVVVIDDLATTGGTKIEAVRKLEAAGLVVRDIVVLIDREQGASGLLAEAGYRLHAVARLPDLMARWLDVGAVTQQQYDDVMSFLATT